MRSCKHQRLPLLFFFVVVCGFSVPAFASSAQAAVSAVSPTYGECSNAAQTLALGVVLSCDHNPTGLTTPTVAHIANVDLTAGGVAPLVVLGNNVVYQTPGQMVPIPNATVSSMADDPTTVIGINGGFFDNNKGPHTASPKEPFSGQLCSGLVTDGRIVKSPPSDSALNVSLNVHADGHLSIGHVTFSGTLSAGDASIPLDGINALNVAAPQPSCPIALMPGPTVADGVTLITPDMGQVLLADSTDGDTNSNYVINDAVLVTAHLAPASTAENSYIVDSIAHSATLTEIPQLLPDQVALLSSSTADLGGAAGWMLAHLPPGTVFTAGGRLSDPTITSLIGGPAPLVENGVATDLSGYYVPTSTTLHAETMVGLDASGRAVTIAVVDEYPGWSAGVDGAQAQQLMLNANVQSAILFDGGGSSTLVANLPGAQPTPPAGACAAGVTVITSQTGENNYPNGCSNQRYVGDGLFFVATGSTVPPTTTPPTAAPARTATPPAAASTGKTPTATVLAATGEDLPPAASAAVALSALGIALAMSASVRKRVRKKPRTNLRP